MNDITTLHRQRGRLVADSRVSFLAGNLDSVQPVTALPQPGLLVFVRHGESVANELNVFAGNDDVPLTAFGREQAREAGRRLAAFGVRFDEIHTSRLGRAKETARLIASEARAQVSPDVRWATGVAALDERDFGAFTGRNRNLAARAVGFAEFEAMLHDPARRPPVGESSGTLYARVRHYYETVLEPARRAGRNVLVVAHKCVLEAMVLVAAGRAPGECFDMKVPNSKPILFDELPRFAECGRRGMQKAGDFVTAHCIELAVLAALAGAALRAVLGAAIPGGLYLDLMLVFLAGAAFLGSLEVNLHQAVQDRGPRYIAGLTARWLPRILVGGALLCHFGPAWAIVGALLVTPPATVAPVLARLWGGDGRRAGLETVLASVLLPVAAAGAAVAGCLPAGVPLGALGAACALIVAATIAGQAVRATAKTRAPAFALRFGWLGPLALAVMAALGAYQLMPLGTGIAIDALVWPFLAFVGVRVALGLYGRLATRRTSFVERCDARIAQQNPNVFLWVALAAAGDAATGFGCLAAFLACLVAENWHRVERERSDLLAALPAQPVLPQPTLKAA
ncbi:MAG TPA: histidine phosphatase family protein [Burkholderiales bacterium]|nr:histidine phosphatase family protein [Burkholderiales bacterium]